MVVENQGLSKAVWASAVGFTVKLSPDVKRATINAEFTAVLDDSVTLQDEPLNASEQIYPTWAPDSTDNAAAFQSWRSYWSANVDQTRAAAKWIATILGATLVALVGTTPLTVVKGAQLNGWFWFGMTAGVILTISVLFLVLRVITPGLTTSRSLLEVPKGGPVGERYKQRADGIAQLRKEIESQRGVQLPIGIASISELMGRFVLEKEILVELAQLQAAEHTPAETAFIEKVMKVRLDRLAELDLTISQLVTLAVFARVRKSSRLARTLGLALAGLAVISFVGAYLSPTQPSPRDSVETYQLDQTSRGPAVVTAETEMSKSTSAVCVAFKGAITSQNNGTDTVNIQSGTNCRKVRIVVPDIDLLQIGS